MHDGQLIGNSHRVSYQIVGLARNVQIARRMSLNGEMYPISCYSIYSNGQGVSVRNRHQSIYQHHSRPLAIDIPINFWQIRVCLQIVMINIINANQSCTLIPSIVCCGSCRITRSSSSNAAVFVSTLMHAKLGLAVTSLISLKSLT